MPSPQPRSAGDAIGYAQGLSPLNEKSYSYVAAYTYDTYDTLKVAAMHSCQRNSFSAPSDERT